MTPPPEGTPWWAWFVIALVTLTAGATGTWMTSRPMRRELRTVRDQVQNSHAVNLRDDMDEKNDGVHASIGDVLSAVADVRRVQSVTSAAVARLDRSVGGIHDDVRGVRSDLTQITGDLGARVLAIERRPFDRGPST